MAKPIINKNGTKKADVIEITKKVTVRALAGNDTVTIKKGSSATVYGGAGGDKILLTRVPSMQSMAKLVPILLPLKAPALVCMCMAATRNSR